MDDEQLISEVLKRIDTIAEVRRVFCDKGAMKEFIKNLRLEKSSKARCS